MKDVRDARDVKAGRAEGVPASDQRSMDADIIRTVADRFRANGEDGSAGLLEAVAARMDIAPLSIEDRRAADQARARIEAEHAAFWQAAEGRRMRVSRVVIFEGPAEWMQEQLGRSLGGGIRRVRRDATITVATGPIVILD